MKFQILWPVEDFTQENVLNNNSIVAKLNYKSFSMLFTGDIEKIAEEKILEEYKNSNILNSLILKSPHHGAKTSSTENFIKKVNPKAVLIGVGKDNKFGHPSKEVLDTYKNQNIKIYRTDENGEIFIKVDKKMRLKIQKFID